MYLLEQLKGELPLGVAASGVYGIISVSGTFPARAVLTVRVHKKWHIGRLRLNIR